MFGVEIDLSQFNRGIETIGGFNHQISDITKNTHTL